MPAGRTTSAMGGRSASKKGAKDRSESEKRAKQTAVRTVNKGRARVNESKTASRSSTEDMASGRGGLRSGKASQGSTRDQLYAEAKRRNVDGRSHMNKAELARALGK
ncbi:plasmid stabilization protein [Actinacidiphila glaucinigra]|uniref:plasmid stabilization protein n=1 Tax=Actinacidiphila glaucinigra TaxID=235986 RepID=UPI0033B5BAB0